MSDWGLIAVGTVDVRATSGTGAVLRVDGPAIAESRDKEIVGELTAIISLSVDSTEGTVEVRLISGSDAVLCL